MIFRNDERKRNHKFGGDKKSVAGITKSMVLRRKEQSEILIKGRIVFVQSNSFGKKGLSAGPNYIRSRVATMTHFCTFGTFDHGVHGLLTVIRNTWG